MPIQCDEYAGVCVIAPQGDLAGPAAAAARQAAESRTATEGVSVVIDLERANFIDSQGLESLLSIRRRCETQGARLALAALSPTCQKILELTRLDRHFECHPDLSSAIKATTV